MEFLTAWEIPVGKAAKIAFDWLKLNYKTTFKDFGDWLLEQFLPAEIRQQTRGPLYNCTQEPRETALEYITRFRGSPRSSLRCPTPSCSTSSSRAYVGSYASR